MRAQQDMRQTYKYTKHLRPKGQLRTRAGQRKNWRNAFVDDQAGMKALGAHWNLRETIWNQSI